MPICLVVDDSPTDRALIGGLLLKEGEDWIVEYAEDGTEALDTLETVTPHIVITDMQMPSMDGLTLVAEVQDRFSHVPVVLVTGRGSESLAVEALQRGAASYVAKADLTSRLGETVKQVLQMKESDRNYKRLIQSLCSSEFNFCLANDPSLIGPLVSLAQQIAAGMELCDATQQHHMGIALDEALINAMYHGNLELPANQLSKVRSFIREGQKNELVEERCQESPYSDRRVHVQFRLCPERIRITVRDDGEGFDPEAVPTPDSSSDDEIGRGLVLVRAFMDEVEFSEQGKQITMVLYTKRDPVAGADGRMQRREMTKE